MKVLSSPFRTALLAIATFGTIGTSTAAWAETAKPWPTAKPITWVVGYVPGGSVDVITRVLAKVVSARIGQAIVVDNRPGATGAIALQYAARSPNDGYTIITVPGPVLSRPGQPRMGTELSAVALISQGPIVFVGGSAAGVPDLKALIARMKARPQDWSFASSGTGTGQHLAGELFNTMAGTRMTHVPYKGGGQAVTDILGGQVALGMLGVTPVLPHIQSGRLKAYAVTTKFRIDSLPDVPTMEEAGLQGYDATQFFVAAGPSGIPPEIVAKLNAAISAAVASPEVRKELTAAGQVPGTLTPGETQEYVVRSLEKFMAVAKRANIDLN